MTTTVKIIGAGVETEIEEELASPDNDYGTLRRALSSMAPGMPKAKITSKKEGENTIIEVTPKLDGKGSGTSPTDHLINCPEQRNPAIAMFLAINGRSVSLGSHDMYNLGMQATASLKKGEEWIERIADAEKILIKATPAPSSVIMPG